MIIHAVRQLNELNIKMNIGKYIEFTVLKENHVYRNTIIQPPKTSCNSTFFQLCLLLGQQHRVQWESPLQFAPTHFGNTRWFSLNLP